MNEVDRRQLQIQRQNHNRKAFKIIFARLAPRKSKSSVPAEFKMLWTKIRKDFPKQLHSINGNEIIDNTKMEYICKQWINREISEFYTESYND